MFVLSSQTSSRKVLCGCNVMTAQQKSLSAVIAFTLATWATLTVCKLLRCAALTDALFDELAPEEASLCRSQLREDHFITGPNEHEAIAIHCQHVVQSVLRLHHKTKHLVCFVQLGASTWSITDMLRRQHDAHAEMTQAVKNNEEIRLQAYAMVQFKENRVAKYITVTKVFQLCHTSVDDMGNSQVRCWPPRLTHMFESIFLSPAHALSCVDAEVTTTDPLVGWRATKYVQILGERATAAMSEDRKSVV